MGNFFVSLLNPKNLGDSQFSQSNNNSKNKKIQNEIKKEPDKFTPHS
jgi:hypothetical protein